MPAADNNGVADTPLGRATRILDAVTLRPLRFSEAQSLLNDLAPSSLNRLLKAMLELGMLERTEDGTYGAGPRLARWQRKEDATLRLLADPILEGLLQRLEATVIIIQRAGDKLVSLDRRTHDNSPALIKPGSVRPINVAVVCGALFMNEEDLHDEHLIKNQIKNANSRASMATMRRLLLHMRKTGIWDDKGQIYPNQVRRIAVPIRKDGEIIASLAVGCWVGRLRDPSYLAQVEAELQRAARHLERGLIKAGYQPDKH